jgi:hypothetical protein
MDRLTEVRVIICEMMLKKICEELNIDTTEIDKHAKEMLGVSRL